MFMSEIPLYGSEISRMHHPIVFKETDSCFSRIWVSQMQEPEPSLLGPWGSRPIFTWRLGFLASRRPRARECREALLVIRRLEVVHRVSSRLLGPVVPSFRALSGRLKFTVRRHKFNKDSLSR